MKPTLDSRQLHAFTALARRGSFTLAAKDLNLTQSAVSHAIKALEQDVGCRLLDRVGRRVLLTQPGEQLLRHAEKILGEMSAARAGMEGLVRWGQALLRIGAGTTACQYILPGALQRFREQFPQCTVRLETGNHAQLLERLRLGQSDLAIGLGPLRQAREEFVFLPLFQDELRLLVAPWHAWAAAERVPLEAIGAETLLVPSPTTLTFQLVTEYFRRENVTPGSVIELGSGEAIKELARIGMGAGLLAPWMARTELAAGSLVSSSLGHRPLIRSWGVVCLKGRRLAAGEEAFVRHCRAVGERLMAAETVSGAPIKFDGEPAPSIGAVVRG
jgi:LysR family transcriptional regulator, low CO2-responsive transcriptional regulator